MGGTAYTRVEEGADRDNIQRDSKFIGPLNEAKRATDCRTFRHRLPNHSCTFFFFLPSSLSVFTTCAPLLQRNQVK